MPSLLVCHWPHSGVILPSVRLGRKVLTPGLISRLDSPRRVLRHGPRLWHATRRKLVLPLSRSLMQRLQESAVRRVFPAGWPKIHHPPRLPSAPLFLAELLSEAPRFLTRVSSHVTYRWATFLLVSLFPLLPSGVTCGEESYKYSARRGLVLRGNYPAPRRENSSPWHLDFISVKRITLDWIRQ